jgi:Mu transposase, C-terminal
MGGDLVNTNAHEMGDIRRDASIDYLRRLIADNGGVTPPGAISRAAKLFGCHRATIHRRLKRVARKRRGRRAYAMPDRLRDLTIACGGDAANALEVAKELKQKTPEFSAVELPTSARTMQRAWSNCLSTADRTMIVEGARKVRENSTVYLPFKAEYRNQYWQSDVCTWPVWVIKPQTKRQLVQPRVILFVDVKTGVITGWGFTLEEPTAEDLLAVLARAILPKQDVHGEPGWGISDNLRIDNAKIYHAGIFKTVTGRLHIALDYCDPFMPEEKGRVERTFWTLNQIGFMGVPGSDRGPRHLNKTFVHNRDTMMTVAEFEEALRRSVTTFNTRKGKVLSPHPTARNARTSPYDRWVGDPTPITALPWHRLLPMLLPARAGTMRKGGIALFGDYYACKSEMLKVGDRYDVRYAPGDISTVWLFRGSTYVGEAYRVSTMTEEQRVEFIAQRRADFRSSAVRADELQQAADQYQDLLSAHSSRRGGHRRLAGRSRPPQAARTHRPSAKARKMARRGSGHA